MVLRAWRRALGLLMDAPGDMLRPNLFFTLLLLAVLPVWLLAVALRAPWGLLALLKVLSALWIWMAFSWLCFAEREGLESRTASVKALLVQWWRARAVERALSFLVVGFSLSWIWLAHNFYARLADQSSHAAILAICGNVVVALLGLQLILVQLPHFGISARKKMNWKGEWKAAWLMGLAFIPQCALALMTVILMSGAMAYVVGMHHILGRLLWVPALLLPLFGAGLIAAFFVCLSDEFLARSLGLPAPVSGNTRFREWLRPWK